MCVADRPYAAGGDLLLGPPCPSTQRAYAWFAGLQSSVRLSSAVSRSRATGPNVRRGGAVSPPRPA